MATIRHSLQKEVFDITEERLVGILNVTKPGKKKKKISFLCAATNKEKPVCAFIHQIKETDKESYKKKNSWPLFELQIVDGKDENKETAELDLTIDRVYKWVASSVPEKHTFIQVLWKLCYRYLPKQKPQFINVPPELIKEDSDKKEGKVVIAPGETLPINSCFFQLDADICAKNCSCSYDLVDYSFLKKGRKYKKETVAEQIVRSIHFKKECGFCDDKRSIDLNLREECEFGFCNRHFQGISEVSDLKFQSNERLMCMTDNLEKEVKVGRRINSNELYTEEKVNHELMEDKLLLKDKKNALDIKESAFDGIRNPNERKLEFPEVFEEERTNKVLMGTKNPDEMFIGTETLFNAHFGEKESTVFRAWDSNGNSQKDKYCQVDYLNKSTHILNSSSKDFQMDTKYACLKNKNDLNSFVYEKGHVNTSGFLDRKCSDGTLMNFSHHDLQNKVGGSESSSSVREKGDSCSEMYYLGSSEEAKYFENGVISIKETEESSKNDVLEKIGLIESNENMEEEPHKHSPWSDDESWDECEGNNISILKDDGWSFKIKTTPDMKSWIGCWEDFEADIFSKINPGLSHRSFQNLNLARTKEGERNNSSLRNYNSSSPSTSTSGPEDQAVGLEKIKESHKSHEKGEKDDDILRIEGERNQDGIVQDVDQASRDDWEYSLFDLGYSEDYDECSIIEEGNDYYDELLDYYELEDHLDNDLYDEWDDDLEVWDFPVMGDERLYQLWRRRYA